MALLLVTIREKDMNHLYKGEWDERIREMVNLNYSAYKINKILQECKADLSFMTVYRRVKVFKREKDNNTTGTETL